jgi:glyoxalase family protein
MKPLEGTHHITCITADAPRNVEFYVGLMGLRLVKKSVNQDDPTIYHLFYGDENGDPGCDLTFFEYPGAPLGRTGAGMIHLIGWRVASSDALKFWEKRLSDHGVELERTDTALRFADLEGLAHELRVVDVPDEPLTADHGEIPREFALQGFDGARAYTIDPERSAAFITETMGMRAIDERTFESRGSQRGSVWAYDVTDVRGVQGAGSVHHIAWADHPEDHERWRERVIAGGMSPTPIIDRFYFKSIYFREPSGVLFEIATIGPGFTVDEPLATLGEKLSLPPAYEHLRDEFDAKLTPLPDVNALRRGTTARF